MNNKLAITVLGNPNSGKTETWKILFDRDVRTGSHIRRLYLNAEEYLDVFLVSGSAEERGMNIEDIIGDADPTIVLCSIQYRSDVLRTLNYFQENGFSLFTQWINPGYSDQALIPDTLGLLSYLLYHDGTVEIRSGKDDARSRVREIKDFVYGWAFSRGLIRK